MNKIYIAYGSNMDKNQMAHRCPEAKFIGTGMIHGYELLFKGSGSGAYATIEPKKYGLVPAYIWLITEADEARLDRYEGFPTFYYKKEIEFEDENVEMQTGMAYIMHEERKLGAPTQEYFQVLADAYEEQGWDIQILHDALDVTFRAWEEEAR